MVMTPAALASVATLVFVAGVIAAAVSAIAWWERRAARVLVPAKARRSAVAGESDPRDRLEATLRLGPQPGAQTPARAEEPTGDLRVAAAEAPIR